MNSEQIAWAKQHDWFIGAGHSVLDGNKIPHVVVRHDTYPGAILIFEDYDKLRAWAGY